MPGIAAGNSAEQGDGDLCGFDQPRPCAHADRDPAESIGIASGAVPEGKEFAQVVIGVAESEEALLGPASMGEGILGSDERKCDR